MGLEFFVPAQTLTGVKLLSNHEASLKNGVKLLNPSMAASSNPFQRGSQGWGVFIHGNHAARQGNGSSWWGCLCDVCFASKKSSEREFFVPARTH